MGLIIGLIVVLVLLGLALYAWWRAHGSPTSLPAGVSPTVLAAISAFLSILAVVLVVLIAVGSGSKTTAGPATLIPGSGGPPVAPPGAPGGPGSGPGSALSTLSVTIASAGVYPASPSDCKGPGDAKFNLNVGGAPNVVSQANGAQVTAQLAEPNGATQTQTQTISGGKVNFDFHYNSLPGNGVYTATVTQVNGQPVLNPRTGPGPSISCG